MQSFSWKYFALTGDVDAYLLFKDIHRNYNNQEYDDEWEEDDSLEIMEEH